MTRGRKVTTLLFKVTKFPQSKERPLPPKNNLPQKHSKLSPKSKEQIEMLEKEFLNSNYLNDKSLQDLINVTSFKKA